MDAFQVMAEILIVGGGTVLAVGLYLYLRFTRKTAQTGDDVNTNDTWQVDSIHIELLADGTCRMHLTGVKITAATEKMARHNETDTSAAGEGRWMG